MCCRNDIQDSCGYSLTEVLMYHHFAKEVPLVAYITQDNNPYLCIMDYHHLTASSLLVFTFSKSLVAPSKLAICKIAPTMTLWRFVLVKVFDSFDSNQHLDNYFLTLNQFLAHI